MVAKISLIEQRKDGKNQYLAAVGRADTLEIRHKYFTRSSKSLEETWSSRGGGSTSLPFAFRPAEFLPQPPGWASKRDWMEPQQGPD